VVDALRRIHAALVPGGLLIDTQPLSPRPAVEADGGRVGTLDMREWAKLIEAVDARIARTVEDGLWTAEGEQRFFVTDTFASGAELADTVKDWQGTRVAQALRKRLTAAEGPALVHQEVRLQVLRAV
jgi:hypothetical protein